MNEIKGFRGLKWDDPPTKEMVLLKRTNFGLTLYELPNDPLSLGKAKLFRVVYMFFNNGLMKVEMGFDGRNNYDLLRERYRQKFGPENGGSEGGSLCASCFWWRQEIYMQLWYFNKEGSSTLSLSHSPTEQKCEKARDGERRLSRGFPSC